MDVDPEPIIWQEDDTRASILGDDLVALLDDIGLSRLGLLLDADSVYRLDIGSGATI